MEKIILPSLRSHVPGVIPGVGKPTWHLPIHIYTKNGIDLDFGPLLLFDRAVIDSQSEEYILTSKRPEFAPLAQSISLLKNEGYIETKDFGSELSKVRATINKHVESIIYDPLPLRKPVLKGIDGYRSNLPIIQRTYKDYDQSLLPLGFGMHLYTMNRFGSINDTEIKRISKLMVSSKKKWTNSDVGDVKEIVRPTITYLYQNLALSEIYCAPFLDVDYYSELYTILRGENIKVFNQEAKITSIKVQEGQKLFNCIIPHLRPSSPKQMLALLKHKSIGDFREYISQAAEEGRSITQNEYDNLLATTIKAERKLGEIKNKIAWGERALSFVPVPAIGWIATGLGFIVENIATRRITKKYNWLYALIKAASPDKR
jgi:hypothetical protein